jgi:rfaE bifunctional protein nucleotidyltransferase chain/domain/rfaE bifunctional protein kinase chain/domain
MGSPAPLLVIGDALLDRDLEGSADRLSPDAPVPVVAGIESTARAGGAGLAATLAARDGREVTLITALSSDAAGRELAVLLEAEGIAVVDLGLDGATPEKIRVRAGGTSIVRLDRGDDGGEVGSATLDARLAIGRANGVLVADYGRGVARDPRLRASLERLRADVPVVWDPHPRGPAPTSGATLVTPNRGEAERFAAGVEGEGLAGVTARARELVRRWSAIYVSVTMGPLGALIAGADDGAPVIVPAPAVAHGDPCGAGDRFASAAAGALADGRLPSEAVAVAVAAASGFVAAGGAAAHGRTKPQDPRPAPEDAITLAARVRAEGGTVVATGGCFDLLHAGHVQMLERARALGDCLIVCLNSDASVGRLKGPDRPLNDEHDRAAVLRALRCVDEVAVFGEDTPEAVLAGLRPHLWCKGGDYTASALPEAPLLETWDGQAVILPFLAGRSTTSLIEQART